MEKTVRSPRLKKSIVLLLLAFVGFQLWNYSTTEFALKDILVNPEFLGIYLPTAFTLGFCSLDFLSVAKLYKPRNQQMSTTVIWFFFAMMVLLFAWNASLTFWAVDLKMYTSGYTSVKELSLWVAGLTWIVRIFLFGAFFLSD